MDFRPLNPAPLLAAALLQAIAIAPAFGHGEKGNIEGSSGGAPSNAVDFPRHNVELLAHLSLADIGGDGNLVRGNDVWGWTDPQTGREYALMGRTDGVAIVDVTDPTAPVYRGILPKSAGSANTAWRDIKVHNNRMYVVADGSTNGLQILDLAQLRTPAPSPRVFAETGRYDGFMAAHNIAINEATGFAYVVGAHNDGAFFNTYSGGLIFLNLHVAPGAPGFAAGGFGSDAYTHDAQAVIYAGPDVRYAGREIAFCANEDTITIVDVTSKSQPVMIGRRTYPGVAYVHQGWLTEDHKYFLSNDELDEIDAPPSRNVSTHIWDVSDLQAPRYIGRHDHGIGGIDHNLYVHQGLIYESNYTTGMRVLRPTNLDEGLLETIAWIDTHPASDSRSFHGAWSVYPFFASGTIAIGDINEGLILARLVRSSFGARYDEWAESRFDPADLANPALESTVWGIDADPDGDGLSNFAEFASDSNPLRDDLGSEPRIEIELLDARPFAVFSFLRRTDAPYLRYDILSSDALETAAAETDFVETRVEPGNSAASERAYFRSAQPLDAAGAARALFLRLRVSKADDLLDAN